jgi:hypothetical protein
METFDLKQTQRYYHLIALKGTKKIIKRAFFNDWNIKEVFTYSVENDYTVSQMAMTSDKQYYQGEIEDAQDISNTAPFTYDIVIVECLKTDITVMCFPFKKMSVDITAALLSKYNILVKSRFIKADLHKLIHANDDTTDLFYEQNHFFVGGVFFSIGDSCLSTVKLAGDRPLDSTLYKEYFRDNLSRYELEKSVLKCKVGVNSDEQVIKLSSTFHVDKFGNYKLYMQSKGKNLLTVSAIFDLLNHIECLAETSNNPVTHIGIA